MFRALTCSSSGGKIVFTQHLVYSCIMNNLGTTSTFCGRYKRFTLHMICSHTMGCRIVCVVRILTRFQLPVKRVPGNVDIWCTFTVH